MSVPLLMMVQGLDALTEELQLARSNSLSQGEVTHRRIMLAGGASQATTYFVTYDFSVGEPAITYTEEQPVTKAAYDRLAVGTLVDIQYIANNPAISRLAANSVGNVVQDQGSMIAWIGALGTVIAGVFVIWQLKRFTDEYRLRRFGHLIIGHVNHCYGKLKVGSRTFAPDDYGGILHGKYLVELYYRFRTPDNHEIRKREVRRRNDLLGQSLPGPDTPVAVLYLDGQHYKAL